LGRDDLAVPVPYRANVTELETIVESALKAIAGAFQNFSDTLAEGSDASPRLTGTDRRDSMVIGTDRTLLTDVEGPGMLREFYLNGGASTNWSVDVEVDGELLFSPGARTWTYYNTLSEQVGMVAALLTAASASPSSANVLSMTEIHFRKTLRIYVYAGSGTVTFDRYVAAWETRA
jgi:hypothetical protein